MSVREHLIEVRARHGHLTPKAVVEDSRPDDHPLHDRIWFDSDEEAAYEQRVERARRLIRSQRLQYVSGERPKTIREWVSITRPEAPQPVYEPVEEVLSSPATRAILLQEMEREWRTLRAKYGDMIEFSEMIQRDLGDAA